MLLFAGAIHWPDDLPRFAAMFQQGFIYDWNTCDWFCVRVLGPQAEQQGAECAQAIAAWRTTETLSCRLYAPICPQGELVCSTPSLYNQWQIE